MGTPSWFRRRPYKHFDVPVGAAFAGSINPDMVGRHAWSPLIHYLKKDRRYKALLGKTVIKDRPIMYASHRDACILSYYSYKLTSSLESWYCSSDVGRSVIAYRSLGRANYHFAETVQKFIRSRNPVTVMCFDVTGFFDNLNHALLKERLRWILDSPNIDEDWYAVLRFMTKYRYVNRDDLYANSTFRARMDDRRSSLIATMSEVKTAGVDIHKNSDKFGIPQGTPISASLSNLYMSGFDEDMIRETSGRGALYQRYSDDILLACEPGAADELEGLIEAMLASRGLKLQKSKTDRKTLAGTGVLTFQYLGYQMGHCEATVRPASLSRQWRAARRAVKRAERAGEAAIAAGSSRKIFTRKLHRRFNDAKARNFFSYARRSAAVLGSPAIGKQTKRLRRFVNREMTRLKARKS